MPGCLDGSSIAPSHHGTEIQISRLYKTTLYSLHALPHPFAELYSSIQLYSSYTTLYTIQRTTSGQLNIDNPRGGVKTITKTAN